MTTAIPPRGNSLDDRAIRGYLERLRADLAPSDTFVSFQADTGSTTADATTDTLQVTGGEGIDTSISSDVLTISGEDASTTNKGIASFETTDFTVTAGAVSIKDTGVDHDATTNFVADEHVAHTGVVLTAGSGLSGGGDISASRTFNVDINSESSVTAEAGDEVLIADVSDSNNIKKVTAQSIANLAPSTTGTIVQVVSAAKTSVFSSSSTTMVDITGLTASITPSSATNTILITAHVSVGSDSNAVSLKLVRDSTDICVGDTASNRDRVTVGVNVGNAAGFTTCGITFLDSPATTSAVAYRIQGQANNTDTWFINSSVTDSDTTNFSRGTSTITLMEIVA